MSRPPLPCMCMLFASLLRPLGAPACDGLVPVRADDPHRPLVNAEIVKITDTGAENPVGNALKAAGRFEDRTLRDLFPDRDFYAFLYSNTLKKGFEKTAVSLAGGLGHTLAVERGTGAVLRLDHIGNHEAYGELLKRAGIVIKNDDDARRIWEAFCALHCKGWKGYPLQRVSEGEWRLGLYSYDQTVSETDGVRTIVRRTHYYRVAADPRTGAALSWKSVVETSDRRTEPSHREAGRPAVPVEPSAPLR